MTRPGREPGWRTDADVWRILARAGASLNTIDIKVAGWEDSSGNYQENLEETTLEEALEATERMIVIAEDPRTQSAKELIGAVRYLLRAQESLRKNNLESCRIHLKAAASATSKAREENPEISEDVLGVVLGAEEATQNAQETAREKKEEQTLGLLARHGALMIAAKRTPVPVTWQTNGYGTSAKETWGTIMQARAGAMEGGFNLENFRAEVEEAALGWCARLVRDAIPIRTINKTMFERALREEETTGAGIDAAWKNHYEVVCRRYSLEIMNAAAYPLGLGEKIIIPKKIAEEGYREKSGGVPAEKTLREIVTWRRDESQRAGIVEGGVVEVGAVSAAALLARATTGAGLTLEEAVAGGLVGVGAASAATLRFAEGFMKPAKGEKIPTLGEALRAAREITEKAPVSNSRGENVGAKAGRGAGFF